MGGEHTFGTRDTLERLGCDATTQLLLHDETGAFTALGAVTRTIPRRIRRLLGGRDRCCRFPGCEMVLGLHAHHLQFWSRGGRTEVPDLVLLCHRHHKNVHEGGWTLSGSRHPRRAHLHQPDRTGGVGRADGVHRSGARADRPRPPSPACAG